MRYAPSGKNQTVQIKIGILSGKGGSALLRRIHHRAR